MIVPKSGLKSELMPNCETKGCEMLSRFHGFGHDFCWGCYSRWMGNFILTSQERYDIDSHLTNGGVCVDTKGQMQLDLRVEN